MASGRCFPDNLSVGAENQAAEVELFEHAGLKGAVEVKGVARAVAAVEGDVAQRGSEVGRVGQRTVTQWRGVGNLEPVYRDGGD